MKMFKNIIRVSNHLSFSMMQSYCKLPNMIFQPEVFRLCNSSSQVLSFRNKYSQHKGVKGIRNRKSMYDAQLVSNEENLEEFRKPEVLQHLKIEDREYDEVAGNLMHVSRQMNTAQNVLVIQPYVKWAPNRNVQMLPDDQLQEANALIHSLPNWTVALSLKVPLESMDRKMLFGSGKLTELKELVYELRQASNDRPLTCLFVSKGSLSFTQKRLLEAEFKLPVMDRYSVVIQILRLHATSAEARIQVAMAEIPYIWAQARDANISMARKQGFSINDTQREILKTRERKLKTELEQIRSHRKLLRNKRKQKNYPIVAVVGYTNAGKTSLIKALTQEEGMQPRNQLFATLDVTAHGGILPCKLDVIYMDTVGFMSDLPTGLIECFVATLEDAILADVIIHVQDLAHPCYITQRDHVENTLKSLAKNVFQFHPDYETEDLKIPPIINVGNKVDLTKCDIKESILQTGEEIFLVSAKQQTGLRDLAFEIENKVLEATGRQKHILRVPNGGSEMAWLYKNATIVDMIPDVNDPEFMMMNVLITEITIQQYERLFIN